MIEDRAGPVEPGRSVLWTPERPGLFPPHSAVRASCRLQPTEIPPAWLVRFPTGAEVVRKAVELRSEVGLPPDRRLLRRRDCEFRVFRSVEEATEMATIHAGFPNIDDFLARAQTILQRRKARSGRSPELHTREIMIEERLREGIDFAHGPESGPGRRPDFLFPPRRPTRTLRSRRTGCACWRSRRPAATAGGRC